MITHSLRLIVLLLGALFLARAAPAASTDASAFGFSPTASGIDNARALQKAVDGGGTIAVSKPGVYPISATVYLGSHPSLVFGNGVIVKKVAENGPFTQGPRWYGLLRHDGVFPLADMAASQKRRPVAAVASAVSFIGWGGCMLDWVRHRLNRWTIPARTAAAGHGAGRATMR